MQHPVTGHRLLGVGVFVAITFLTLPHPTPLSISPAGAAQGLGSIAAYMSLPGDQVVTVPPGVYSGGTVTVTHPATDGRYRGWLVLIPRDPGSVVIDLSSADLVLKSSTSRIAMVGFRFINGSVWLRGSDLMLWHTDHTFPTEVWAKEPRPRTHRAPRTLYIDSGATGIGVYGSDLHDTGAAVVVRQASAVTLQGIHTWNLTDQGADPADLIRPDAIGGGAGDISGLRVLDAYLEGRTFFAAGATGVSVDLDRVWMTKSPSAGITLASSTINGQAPGKISGLRTNVRSWGHASGHDRIDIYDGRQYLEPRFNEIPTRIDLVDDHVTTEPPPATEKSPSEVWRRTHSMNEWPAILAAPTQVASSRAGEWWRPAGAGAMVVLCVVLGTLLLRRRRRARPGAPAA